MSYVINYEGGRFILPKLNISMVFNSGAPYISTSDTLDIIRSQATQIAVETSNAYYKSCVTDDNLIGYKKNVDGSQGYPIYRTSPPYKIDDRYELYLNIFDVNPQGGRYIFAFGLKDTLDGTIYSDSLGYSTFNQMDKFFPEIFMFADSAGNAYIAFINKSAYSSYGYGLSSGRIAPDAYYTKEVYEVLFPLGDIDTSDPYWGGDYSSTGGGQGNFDGSSEPIDFPPMPALSAADTRFITLYNPTLSQLRELSAYMWSDVFSVDTFKKIFADPMDAILGLSILPVAIPSDGTKEVKVGNISTGISLSVASTQFVKVDCGSINVNEYWGAYLDYEPYTQAQIFLPYIGTRPISVDEIMGKTIHVVYHVDILTGACCCFVKCGDSVLYTFNGQCSLPIPITGANYTSVVNGVISVAASVGSLVASGGASAPTAVASIASSAVNQMKPQIEKSGSISGSAGILNMQTPYLILIRPRQALPSKQNEFIGYPSLITVQLTELTGYTEVQSIHLENIPATQEELTEIESLLKGGVIF